MDLDKSYLKMGHHWIIFSVCQLSANEDHGFLQYIDSRDNVAYFEMIKRNIHFWIWIAFQAFAFQGQYAFPHQDVSVFVWSNDSYSYSPVLPSTFQATTLPSVHPIQQGLNINTALNHSI